MVALLLVWFSGRKSSETKQAKKEAENAKKEAAKWVNADNESVPQRLRRLAKKRPDS